MFTLRLPSPGIWWLLPYEKKDMYYKESGKWRSKWSEVEVVQPCPTFVTPWPVACQDLLSMEFSRQKYWSELPFPSPGDLLDPGIEPGSPALQADSLPSEPPGNPKAGRLRYYFTKIIGINPELYVTFPPKNLTWGGKKENTWLGSESKNMY